jgi:DNA-binding GntR family transcriptional regulator
MPKAMLENNQLEPGKVYNGSELAQQLAVSNTPVRGALLDLATRGFITRLPVSLLLVECETRFDFAKGFPEDPR